jgi:primosomal protein N'
VWRWHILVKAPRDCDISAPVGAALKTAKRAAGVAIVADVDPVDLL